MDDGPRQDALQDRCDRWLAWHGRRTPADTYAEIDALSGVLEADRYGGGGVVTTLEQEVAELLGKPAAVFMPSGTMAQQIAVRIHADAHGCPTVLMHPLAHPLLWEDQALERLHHLRVRQVGSTTSMLTLADLTAVAEPASTLLLELPQRELGGRLPSWQALQSYVAWARERGMAVHMDGARLWESAPFYDRSLAEIADLFDTVYVSFYKGLGGTAGACLAGPEDVIDQAREWRHRHGGTLWGLWPLASASLAGLRTRLPRMAAYRDHAIAIAAALADVDGVEVSPPVPHVNMMHVSLRTDPASFRARAMQLALEESTWTFTGSYPTDRDGWQRIELTVGDATMELTAAEVARVIGKLAAPVSAATPAEELVEVLDADGRIERLATRAEVRANGLRHRCTYVMVMTSDDELVVHKRADWKDVEPGFWDFAFGGLCDPGEPWDEAAARELAEEAGLTDVALEPLGAVEWSAADGSAALQGRAYLSRYDGALAPDDGEVVALDLVPLSHLDDWLASHHVVSDSSTVLPDLLRAHVSARR